VRKASFWIALCLLAAANLSVSQRADADPIEGCNPEIHHCMSDCTTGVEVCKSASSQLHWHCGRTCS
jgi:hypothetical protein